MMFNVLLETPGPEPTASQVDDWMDALAGYHVSMGASLERPTWHVTMSLPAESLAQALTTTVAVVERVLTRPVIAAEVVPTAEFDRRNGMTPLSELMGVTEIAKHLGVTRQAVLKMIHARKFVTATRVGETWAVARPEVYARRESLGEAASTLT